MRAYASRIAQDWTFEAVSFIMGIPFGMSNSQVISYLEVHPTLCAYYVRSSFVSFLDAKGRHNGL